MTPILEIFFLTLTENSSVVISTRPEIAVGTHFHVQHGTKRTLLFLPAEGEAPWLLFLSSVSSLSGGTVEPEKIYSYILNVTGQVCESQEKDKQQ